MSSSLHDHPGLGPAQLVEVAEGIFAYIQPDGSWYINNTGFIVGSSSVISIDACSTEKRTRAYRERIASVSPAPITTLVNTHHHGDHTYGNSVLGAAVIVGHERCRTEMIDGGLPADTGFWDPVDWGDVTLAPPTLTFRDAVRLWSDDRPIDVQYVGQDAHTTNDSLVWLPEESVLFAGDLLFNGGTPFALMGSVAGTIEVLTAIVKPIPATVIIPGHGGPSDPSLIDTMIAYLNFVLDTAKAGMSAGLTPLDAARETDLGIYGEWLDSERLVGNLHRAYADLDPVHRLVDIPATLRDMVEFNGGKPLSCYA
jgi:cyclase